MNNVGKDVAMEVCCKYFEKDYNCCETVLLAFSELLGMESDIIPRIATPFGGGIHQRRHMCGALTGAIMAIGLRYGRSTPQGDREPVSERTGRIVEKFTEKYGSTNCIEVLGFTPDDLEKVKRNKQQLRANICTPLIKQVAEWLWEELE